ncbi:hypothetical protein [Streptomyces sp. CBMA152]|uniref:hypothetical protein n=1 Tax=Streptomyces sp. CBMA152 TaxID=1896312 RepID=UPI0016618471|nr:hypothetical protein [Streptomyces sp. CBMA152]MBD0746204.1 hypothetical protein [Streptomyces sp. CBMA152]
MLLITLAFAIFNVGFEQLVQWQFGVMGALALVLLSIGHKGHNHTCTTAGAVILAVLIVQPNLN